MVANLFHFRPVGFRRHDDAARALYRLGDERGDLVDTEFLDLVGDGLRDLFAELGAIEVLAELAAFGEPVGLLDMHHVRNDAALGVHLVHAAEAGRGDGAAVVGVLAADHDAFLRLAENVPVAPHQAQYRVVRFRAGTGEKGVVDVRRRDLGEQRRQLGCRRRGRLEERVVVGQLADLFRRGVDQALLAVTHVHAPQPGHHVEQLVAVGIGQEDTVGRFDYARRLLFQVVGVGERVEVMIIHPLPFFGIAGHCCGRGIHGVCLKPLTVNAPVPRG